MQARRVAWRFGVRTLVGGGLAAFLAFPLVMAVAVTFAGKGALVTIATLWGGLGFGRYLVNSLLVSAASGTLALVLALPVADLLARRAHLRWGLPALVQLPHLFPTLTLAFSLYVLVEGAGLTDRRWVLALVYAGVHLPLLVTWLWRGFSSLPPELADASSLDGAGFLQGLWLVRIPLRLDWVLRAGLWGFALAWNDFLIANLLTRSPQSRTVPVFLAASGDLREGFDYRAVTAACCICLLVACLLAPWLLRRGPDHAERT